MLEFTIGSATMKSALADLNKVIERNPSVVELSNIHVQMNESGQVTLTARDNEISMRKTLQAESWKGSGVLCVDACQFAASFEGLGEKDITITYDSQKNVISITDNDCSIDFLCGNSEKYPLPTKEEDNGTTLYLDGKVLREGIGRVKYASCKNDPIRIVMCAVCIEGKDNTLSFYATDGRVLTMLDTKVDNCGEFKALLSNKTTNILYSVLKDGKRVKMQVTDYYAYIDCGGMSIHTRLVEGKAPNYRGVIPVCYHHIEVDKALLTAKLKRTSLFACCSGLVKLEIEGNKMTLTAKDDDFFNRSITETLPITKKWADDGKEFPEVLKVGISAPILLKLIGAFTGEKLDMQFTGEQNRPIRIEGDNSTSIIMPMLLNDEKPQEESKEEETEEQEIEEEVA